MEKLYALLSIVFMMSFVMVFDRLHHGSENARFSKSGLLSQSEVERIRLILSACQE